MVDRVSPSDGKVPDFSIKKEYDRVIGQIELMEPSTAYVAVQGIVVPTLNALHNNRSLQNTTLSSPLMYAPSKTSASSVSGAERSHQILKELQEKFANIQKQLTDLYANRQEVIDRWVDSTESNPIRSDNQALKNFYYSRQNIERDLDQIKNGIAEFEKHMPTSKDKTNLVQQLKKIHSDLVSKIPESRIFSKRTGYWTIPSDVIVDISSIATQRFHWKEYASESSKVMKWSDSEDLNLPKNPLGIFEMVIDANRSKYNEFLTALSNGKNNISAFYKTAGSRALHPFLMRDLDTQSAYMYLITVFLPLLQNESAQVLEEQGETMKQVAKAYDKWSEIQKELNELAEIMQTLKKKGLIDQSGKLEITNISSLPSFETKDPMKVILIKDSDQSFKPLIDKSKALRVKIEEMQALLKDLEKKLPPSQQSLIATMKETTSQLILKREVPYIFYYHESAKSSLRFEIKSNLINLPNDEDFDYARKFIFSIMHSEYFFMADADQTKFKAYMDNIAQGITALTSISNMTQQELQIATQYYNSLLGLQKSSFDSLNKTMQTILNNTR